MAVLEVQEISKSFNAMLAVNNVSFTANRGEILGFLGPNGAGKTTTIRMIMGIIRPDTGAIRFAFDGTPTVLSKEGIGYLSEERGLYEDAKVLDVLVYLAQLKGFTCAEAREQAASWLD
ncbi:MAG: ATP-binding cassette domain-containing protein [Candidatus Bipolaricaulota bacterium]|nr:ATP-binding cassette domain-containing protein [Candidatus Bipolaricaulota bacterium]